MLIAGAVCPHPPLLMPDALGAASAAPPEALRQVLAACDRAVRGLLAAAPDLVAVVGGGPATVEFPPGAAGSLREFGVEASVGAGDPVLPLSLTIGRWLLERAGLAVSTPGGARAPAPGARPAAPHVAGRAARSERAAAGRVVGTRAAARPASGAGVPAGRPGPELLLQAVDHRAAPGECRTLGAAIAERAGRVALLAMGDASARRARQAPGAPDPLAMEYDDDVAEALAAADARWLGKLDPSFDEQLAVSGRAAWQVLAGAAASRRLHGRLLCMATPYEVTYLVAAWDELRAG